MHTLTRIIKLCDDLKEAQRKVDEIKSQLNFLTNGSEPTLVLNKKNGKSPRVRRKMSRGAQKYWALMSPEERRMEIQRRREVSEDKKILNPGGNNGL